MTFISAQLKGKRTENKGAKGISDFNLETAVQQEETEKTEKTENGRLKAGELREVVCFNQPSCQSLVFVAAFVGTFVAKVYRVLTPGLL